MKNIAIFIFAFSLLLIVGCWKDQIGRSFSVSGTLLKDCGGQPIANAPVRADLITSHLFSGDVFGIGNAVTDANGHFSMKCTISTGGNLVIGVNGYKYVDNYQLSMQYPDIDFKNIYGSVSQFVYVKIVVTGTPYTAMDTLFVLSANAPDTIYSITSKNLTLGYVQTGSRFLDQSVTASRPNNIFRNDTGYVNWGIGYNDYQKSLLSGQTDGTKYPYYHMLKYAHQGCEGMDTVVLNLPQ